MGKGSSLIRAFHTLSLFSIHRKNIIRIITAEDEYSKWGGVPQHFHERSHGESFLQLVQSNFSGSGYKDVYRKQGTAFKKAVE